MAIIEKAVASLDELVRETLLASRGLPKDRFLWFRGVTSDKHLLIPKIMREHHPFDRVREREERLLTRFRQRSMAYWKEGYGQDAWDHLFAMQHYGLPTRLLDWSENLMVAVFFALQKHANLPDQPDDVPVVWALDPIAWNRNTPHLLGYGDTIHVLTTANEEVDSYKPFTNKKMTRFPLALFGSHNSGRIVAQRGTFFMWGNEVKSIEDFLAEEVKCDAWRFRLEMDPREMFKDVQSIGFTETMIFPEMSYLAEELTRLEGWR